ncbi:penicillin-binding transpeptidase domain-containing protein [Paenibacillus thermoaerophilus]|uniref:Penicillin-binding transpeptidase domain-containing protein n=1 Tax=Paenibacillus thermoaerophilus TaxID=1215385 RepID=A0ABW2V0B7_9BACL|nr:penicillin-binding transpeptidase domain-containing protein [Paenibacillus thermoaerophilus]TMV19073.1 hypothetical protein FE781_00755 [Paenibacillus thermoaerophilus]
MNGSLKWRAIMAGGLFSLFFMGLIGRLYWIQVVDAAELMDAAQDVWESSHVLTADRGGIYDRNGNPLAVDGAAYTVAVNPQFINGNGLQKVVASKLSQLIGKPESEMLDLFAKEAAKERQRIHVELNPQGRKIDAKIGEDIIKTFSDGKNKCVKYPTYVNCSGYGVLLMNQKKRFYPSERTAAHLLGFVNNEDKPGAGLELKYDELLRGVDGSIRFKKDKMGYRLPDADVEHIEPVHGKDLKLTIDKTIQSYMETTLEKVYKEWKPKSVTAIAADPNTMQILGLVNYPNYDPNQFNKAQEEDFRNHAIQSVYEPGSTFKIVTLAAAVEEGVFHPDEMFEAGMIKVTGQEIHDHDRVRRTISYREGLLRSSNVAFIKLGLERLGKDKLKEYIERFGFGAKTGIDLPAEGIGKIDFNYPVEVATASFGQGVSVTAIQQIAAVSAIANGGKLMKPYVVQEITDPNTKETVKIEPTVVRQVVSPETAKQVALLLEEVVSNQEIGTGRRAYIDGYRVAGKTGTAQKVGPDGQYMKDKWVVSFIGFAPVENPKIALIIIADDPDLKGDYRQGGLVAGPAFKEIVSQALRYWKIEPEASAIRSDNLLSGEEVYTRKAGAYEQQPVAAVTETLRKQGIPYEVLGKGNTVVAQYPAAGTEMGQLQRMVLMSEPPASLDLPDLTGRSLREALELCALFGAACQAEGEGYVKAQQVVEGEGGKTVKLTLTPELPASKPVATPGPTATPKPSAKPGGGKTAAGPSPKATPKPTPSSKPSAAAR